MLSPYDPDDRLARRMHGGAAPAARPAPDYLVPLGRTIGFPANGAVSNLAHTPTRSRRCAASCAPARFDVVHLHEPVAPVVCWDALVSTGAPLVGTFHCYSENRFSNNLANLLGARRRCSTASTCASPSPRRPRGPGGASSAATTA